MTVTATSPRERTSRAHFYAFLGALFLSSGVFLWMVAPFVLSLFFGALLAVISQPVYRRLCALNIGRRAAAALCTALLLVLVLGPLAGFAVLAIREGVAVGRQLAELKEFSPKALTRTLDNTKVARAFGAPEAVNAKLKAAIQSAGLSVSVGVLKVAKGIPEFLLQLILALVALYFFLIDGRRFVDFVLSRAAFENDVRDKLRRTFTDMALSTVLAGFAAAAAQAAVICAAFLVLGIPGAFLAGGGTFILAWLPLLGSFPASAAGIAYLYTQDEFGRMGGMIACGLAAGVVDNLVRPLVLKGRSDLHPLVGLVAIIAGIDMCGILGIFIGPLLAAVLISLLEIWPEIGARFGVDVTDGAR